LGFGYAYGAVRTGCRLNFQLLERGIYASFHSSCLFRLVSRERQQSMSLRVSLRY
jgi:hypothetical protein